MKILIFYLSFIFMYLTNGEHLKFEFNDLTGIEHRFDKDIFIINLKHVNENKKLSLKCSSEVKSAQINITFSGLINKSIRVWLKKNQISKKSYSENP